MTKITNYYSHPKNIDGGLPDKFKTQNFYDRNIFGETPDKSGANATGSIHRQATKYCAENNYSHCCFKSSQSKLTCIDKGFLIDIDAKFYVW